MGDNLTDDEIRRFADACADSSNEAARQAMMWAGASSATGVLAKILLATPEERDRLTGLIRKAISE